MLPLVPAASPSRMDHVWGAVAGLIGGAGVALLYRALAIDVMAVVAPTTAVCAVAIPSRRLPTAIIGTVIAGGTLDMLANLLYMIATRSGPLSVVVTLASLYPRAP